MIPAASSQSAAGPAVAIPAGCAIVGSGPLLTKHPVVPYYLTFRSSAMLHFQPCQFGKYSLLEKLASGGMAELFKAKITGDHGFEKILVLKRILPHLEGEQELVEAFIDEARLAARLQHQNIVQIVDFGSVDGHYFIAMEYLDGLDLRTILNLARQSGTPLSLAHTLLIAARACDGLHYAHTLAGEDGAPLNIVHRDISPANIFITRSGEIKVIDFGIARAASHNRLTVAGSLKGKIRYMAPEQAAGRAIDHRADIYAIGAVLYEILAGRPLFCGDSWEVIEQVKSGNYTPVEEAIPGQPAELYRLLQRSLANEPAARYQSCLEMLTDIEACLSALDLRPSSRSLMEYVGSLPGVGQPLTTPGTDHDQATIICNETAPAPETERRPPRIPLAPATKTPTRRGPFTFLFDAFHDHLPKLAVGAGVCLLLLLAFFSLTHRYTAFNLWVPADYSFHSVNYKNGGELLPAGSPIHDLKLDEAANTISFTTSNARRLTIHFAAKWHPGRSLADFAEQLASSKSLRRLTRGFSDAELAAIKAGQVSEGMSKAAVLVAYGYPPEHATPDLDADRWTYWLSRFNSRTLCFDNDRLLASCTPQKSAEAEKSPARKAKDDFVGAMEGLFR